MAARTSQYNFQSPIYKEFPHLQNDAHNLERKQNQFQ